MSQLDRFLVFAFSHQTVIIEILFALILSIVVLWLFSHLNQENKQIDTLQNVDEIEAALRRVLNSSQRPSTASDISQLISDDDISLDEPLPVIKKPTASVAVPTAAVAPTSPTAAAAPAAPEAPKANSIQITSLEDLPAAAPAVVSAPVAPSAAQAAVAAAAPAGGASIDPAEIARLKAENEIKEKKLEDVEKALTQAKLELLRTQEQVVQAPAPSSQGNTDELQAKIRILESRLSEYEIIEDDIANLSLYKEENSRLKSEMEKIKVVEPARSEKTSAAPAESKVPENVATSTVASVVAEEPKDSGLSDVALAMKMTSAMAAEVPKEVTPDRVPIDPEKLLKEFDGMAQAAAAAPSPASSTVATVEEKDSSQKLIEEFENFIKGSGS